MEIVLLVIRLILFGVFAVAGVSKLLDSEGAKKALREFGTPEEFAPFFAVALPFAEIVFSVCFLFTSMSWVGSAGALVLLASFIGGMIWQMVQGRAPDCHCFGQIHSEPVGMKSLVRNIIFAVMALVLLFSGKANQGLELANTSSAMLQMVLILGLVILGVVLLGYLVKLSAQQNEIVRRLGVLELASGEPSAVERNEAGDPYDGLPIGAPMPDFAIRDINGRIVRFEDLLDGRNPFLFFFAGPDCGPCEAMLPEIAEWESELSDRLRFVFVSSGSIEVNRTKFGSNASRIVLVEGERGLAASVGAKWTPTALFVNAAGNIAGHIAVGDVAVRRLIEQIKLRDLSDEFVYFLGMNGQKKPKIGEKVPKFAVSDSSGREITERDLSGRKTLVAFSSPGCSHCGTLLQQVSEWEQRKKPGDPDLIIFTDASHEDGPSAGIKSPVIIDKGHRTSAKLGMRGVPSAVLINEDGVIVTEAAVGPDNIWALIGGKE